LLLAFSAALGLSTSVRSQAPPIPAQQQGAPAQQQAQSPLGSANEFRPGPFGEPRPNIGANPTPLIRRSTDCPLGYIAPKGMQHVAHLVVCVVKPPGLVVVTNVAGPGAGPAGQLSSMPSSVLGSPTINQCIGRTQGSYACGRSGTECCGPKQDNLCFAGAFACYVDGIGTGPRTACCISK
jgi:hypothetical protein